MQILNNYWFFWFVIGFVLLCLEVATPGIVFMFFGLGAWTVMLLLVIYPLPVYLQWTLFIVLSLVFLVVLRRKLTAIFRKTESGRNDSLREPLVADQYIGHEVIVIKAISSNKSGLVEFNGSNWQARSQHSLEEGATAKIVELKDLVIWVDPL
jgi:membrane protein implicated in regulation of membrane protease activity